MSVPAIFSCSNCAHIRIQKFGIFKYTLEDRDIIEPSRIFTPFEGGGPTTVQTFVFQIRSRIIFLGILSRCDKSKIIFYRPNSFHDIFNTLNLNELLFIHFSFIVCPCRALYNRRNRGTLRSYP